jgi:predicted membrane channel-forming protein YqfA (hemolysin III family)
LAVTVVVELIAATIITKLFVLTADQFMTTFLTYFWHTSKLGPCRFKANDYWR